MIAPADGSFFSHEKNSLEGFTINYHVFSMNSQATTLIDGG